MGNETIKFDNVKYQFYSTQIHPLQGQVSVYKIDGEGAYVMKKVTFHNDQIISIANNIQKIPNQNLIRYYGHQSSSSAHLCTQVITSISVTTYWQYLNHDLNKDSLLNLNMLKQQKKLWSILNASVQAAKYLSEHGIALQFNPYIIQFSPQKAVKIYWANVSKTNSHRNYYKYFSDDQLIKSIYSPQQFYSMKIKTQNRKINIYKCSIYSLALLIISYIQGKNPSEYYDYQKFTIDYLNIHKVLFFCQKHYSSIFSIILWKMLQQDPIKRIDYQQIIYLIKNHQNQNLNSQNIFESRISKTDKRSVKVSLRI